MNQKLALSLNQLAFGLQHGVLGATNHRMGVWTQGCSLTKCQGCASVHTWPQNRGTEVLPAQLVALGLRQKRLPSGLTISGGEPTDQAEAVTELVRMFRQQLPESEIVLYTGLDWSHFEDKYTSLMKHIDVVVAGPYRNDMEATAMSGSSNQQVKLLTPLARQLYEDWQSWPKHLQQVSATSASKVVAVGIPELSSMQTVADNTGTRKVSWQRRINAVNIHEGDKP